MELTKFDGQNKEELSLIEVAHAVLADHGEKLAFADLVNEVQQFLGKSDEEIRERLSQFYTDLNVDGSFISLGDNMWGLRSWYAIDSIDEAVHLDDEDDAPTRKKKRKKVNAFLDDSADDDDVIDYNDDDPEDDDFGDIDEDDVDDDEDDDDDEELKAANDFDDVDDEDEDMLEDGIEGQLSELSDDDEEDEDEEFSDEEK